MDYTKYLPNDMLKQTLYPLPVKDIMAMCSTDTKIQSICNDEQFWKEYVLQNHNITKPWKELAKLTDNQKIINIYQLGRYYKLLISADMTLKELLNQVNLIIPNINTYKLKLKHPFHFQESVVIRYFDKIEYFDQRGQYSTYYNQNYPLNHKLLYEMLYQIDV